MRNKRNNRPPVFVLYLRYQMTIEGHPQWDLIPQMEPVIWSDGTRGPAEIIHLSMVRPLGPSFRQNTTWDLGAPSTDNDFRLLPVHLHLMGGIGVLAVIQESQLGWVARLLAPSCFISPRRFQAKSNSAGPLIRESQWCCGARLLAPSCFIYYLVWGARLLAISS